MTEEINKTLDTVLKAIEDLKPLVKDVQEIKTLSQNTNKKMSSLSEEVKTLVNENKALKFEIKTLKHENENLKSKIEDLEQYTRKDNILISGIPYENKENLREKIIFLAQKMDINLTNQDINTSHRLGNLNQTTPLTIARLNNRDLKRELIFKARSRKLNGKEVGFGHSNPIYITDQLTKKMSEIMKAAKMLKGKEIIKYVWSQDGKIFVRETDESRAIKIDSMDQLKTLEEEAIEDEGQGDAESQNENPVFEDEESGTTNEDSEDEERAKKMATIKNKNQKQPTRSRQQTLDNFRQPGQTESLRNKTTRSSNRKTPATNRKYR